MVHPTTDLPSSDREEKKTFLTQYGSAAYWLQLEKYVSLDAVVRATLEVVREEALPDLAFVLEEHSGTNYFYLLKSYDHPRTWKERLWGRDEYEVGFRIQMRVKDFDTLHVTIHRGRPSESPSPPNGMSAFVDRDYGRAFELLDQYATALNKALQEAPEALREYWMKTVNESHGIFFCESLAPLLKAKTTDAEDLSRSGRAVADELSVVYKGRGGDSGRYLRTLQLAGERFAHSGEDLVNISRSLTQHWREFKGQSGPLYDLIAEHIQQGGITSMEQLQRFDHHQYFTPTFIEYQRLQPAP